MFEGRSLIRWSARCPQLESDRSSNILLFYELVHCYFAKGNINFNTHDDAEVLRVTETWLDPDTGNSNSEKYLVNRLYPYKSCSPDDESTRLPTTPWIHPDVASLRRSQPPCAGSRRRFSTLHIPVHPPRRTLLLYASRFTSLPSTTILLDLRLLVRDQGREVSRKHP